ncbi:MerR-like DNA binding protein [Plasticicumulans lactativorans]|uniref:MerR-like DNA binding protein n=1 Tax=Plasticicumulans lactativorans TaxID=1133106 RepID=A0A4R2L8W3_9GAMM|nr:MerR family transcriptional regulator [Plasticicumulans lactativorans]TCO80669.1 MerR-like DNA binding protein [Plasticicumulans lactativorans]
MNSPADESAPPAAEQLYRIGTVSRLTGIATVTLRMWERRYAVVDPNRSEGRNRLYDRDDIARLAIIKRLVDAGHAIGTVAGLTLAQLQERLELVERPDAAVAEPAGRQAAPVRVAVLGNALPARVARLGAELVGLSVVANLREPARFAAEVPALAPQVLVLEYPLVDAATAAAVEALRRHCGAHHAVVVYGFGSRGAVRGLDTASITPLRAPVGMAELRLACRAGARAPLLPAGRPAPDLGLPAGGVPARRYDTDALERIAATTPSLACECPHHLVDLVNSLAAFEDYSAACEHRNPDDAVLHAYLHATTAQARALMEEALTRVARAEGLID